MLRGALSASTILLITVALGIPAVLLALVDRSGRTTHGVVRLWARTCLKLVGVSLDCEGLERIPAGSVVLASNHTSAVDIPLLYAALPAEFRFVHKRSLYWVPIVGQILLLGGHIGIDRRRAFQARRGLQAAAERIRSGTSVLVFPEGTRSRDGRVATFKRGSFTLAIRAGVPIVPVSLSGVRDVLPAGPLSLRSGRVRVSVHPPVETAGRSVDDAEPLALQVETVVRQGCES